MKYRLKFAGSAMMLALTGAFSTGGAALLTPPAQAAEALRQSIFSIKNMTCAVCPVTVRTAMQNVKGVNSVKIDFDAKTATVIYDPSVTSPDETSVATVIATGNCPADQPPGIGANGPVAFSTRVFPSGNGVVPSQVMRWMMLWLPVVT